jgi:hypothetical protein
MISKVKVTVMLNTFHISLIKLLSYIDTSNKIKNYAVYNIHRLAENSHHINTGACFCTRLNSYLIRISNVIYISVLGRCGRTHSPKFDMGSVDTFLLNKMTERFLSQYPVPPYFACKCSNKEKSAK